MFCLTLLTFAVKKKKKNKRWPKPVLGEKRVFHLSFPGCNPLLSKVNQVCTLFGHFKKKSQFWPSYDFDLNFPISQKVTDEGETDDFISATWIEYHSSPS